MTDLPFRRIVVRFRQGSRALRPPMQSIVEIARSWRLDLVGTYVPDPNLRRIAEHPASREFRLHEYKWQTVEFASMTSQLDSVCRECEQEFARVLQLANVQGRFANEVSETAEDLLVVYEPDDPMDQMASSFRQEIGDVLAAGNAMLVVPRRVARSRGSIVAISGEEDRKLIALGTELASEIGERLYSLDMPASDKLASLPMRLEPLRPRLLLASRDILEEQAGRLAFLASICHVPTLVPAVETVISSHSANEG
jgi:hypothetical protein